MTTATVTAEVTCTRCNGSGVFYVHDTGLSEARPATPEGGQCYKCKGSGIEPPVKIYPPKQNKTNEGVLNMTATNQMTMGITNEMQIHTFGAIVHIVEAKGGGNKMCSIFDIHDIFKKNGVETSKIMIEAVIDVLIQKKYVRYFRNDRGYVYFGITGLGWSNWAQRIIKKDDVASTQEEALEEPSSLSDEEREILDSLTGIELNEDEVKSIIEEKTKGKGKGKV